MADDLQQKIINYIDYIKSKPQEVKYFYLEKGRCFIVNGEKIKLLPLQYNKHYSRDEFYIHVNPDEKKIMFYSYDVVEYLSDTHTNQEEGLFEWDECVKSIYNFLTMELKNLSAASSPYSDIAEGKLKPSSIVSNLTPPVSPYHQNRTTYYNSGMTDSYKEREAFNDKLAALMKDGKTSIAIDHINATIDKMCKEKKFESVDSILRFISMDKLNAPTMLSLLSITRGADHVLKDRKEFYGKVKTYLTKIKPGKVDYFLRNVEPGKEYKDVIKYEV